MFRLFIFLSLFGITSSLLASEGLASAIVSEENPVKLYTKDYYANGVLKAEGWEMGNMKMGYWIFYYKNGQVKSKGHFQNNYQNGYWYFYSEIGIVKKEGHYLSGKAENWWIFYDIANATITKFQYKNNKKNGYALCYFNNKLKRAEKYEDNLKVGTWTSLFAFRRDNPNVSF